MIRITLILTAGTSKNEETVLDVVGNGVDVNLNNHRLILMVDHYMYEHLLWAGMTYEFVMVTL